MTYFNLELSTILSTLFLIAIYFNFNLKATIFKKRVRFSNTSVKRTKKKQVCLKKTKKKQVCLADVSVRVL